MNLNKTAVASAVVLSALLVGCASKERAVVAFSYVVEKEKGLPPGMKSIAIMPAQVGETTDRKWSEMCVTVVQALINESRTKFGTDITVTERRDTKPVWEEADLMAAGLSTKKGGGSGGQLTGADGFLLSNINVKEDLTRGKQRTLSGFDIAGWGGHGAGGGGGRVETQEVETVTRNLTVQTEFKLMDTNAKVWEFSNPRTYQATDKTKASPIFGSSRTEAELTPKDRIIGALVERGAREFVSSLMPCRVDVEAEVVSSGSANSSEGVRQLRAENFLGAVNAFKTATAENPSDHQSWYGAGVASEAAGNYEQALNYYKQACAGKDDPQYADARDRLKAYGSRIRRGATSQ